MKIFRESSILESMTLSSRSDFSVSKLLINIIKVSEKMKIEMLSTIIMLMLCFCKALETEAVGVTDKYT